MKCYAYLDDGTVCGRTPAHFLDEQRGCYVCFSHRPEGAVEADMKSRVAIIVIHRDGWWSYRIGDAAGRELFSASNLMDRSSALVEAAERCLQLDVGLVIV